MKSISSGIDPDPEVNDTEEEGSLNSSVEKIEESAQVSDIGTEVYAAGSSEYSNDLVSSKSTRKRQKQESDMLKNREDHKLTSTLINESQLQLTKELITLNRKLLEIIERSDKELKESLAIINNVLQDISNTIRQSVGILAQNIKRSDDRTLYSVHLFCIRWFLLINLFSNVLYSLECFKHSNMFSKHSITFDITYLLSC